MTGFRLATVERLRERQAQLCIQQLHAASQDLVRAQEGREALLEDLRGSSMPATRVSADELVMASFYRERLRGDIRDGEEEIGRRAELLNQRRIAWLAANTRLRAITALHDRYRAARRAALARQQQLELDELAGTRRARPGSTDDSETGYDSVGAS